jgi:hypothetical protein
MTINLKLWKGSLKKWKKLSHVGYELLQFVVKADMEQLKLMVKP